MLLRGSIKKNLTFMMTVITVSMITVVAIIVIVIDQRASREALLHRIDSLSRIISVRSVAAITFDDNQTAEAILGSLSEDSSIMSACIYKQGDALFASYYKDASGVCVIGVVAIVVAGVVPAAAPVEAHGPPRLERHHGTAAPALPLVTRGPGPSPATCRVSGTRWRPSSDWYR